MSWRPANTAPSGQKVIVHYWNACGKSRQVYALYAEHGCVEVVSEFGDDELVDIIGGAEFLPEGWYELVESPHVDFLYVPLGATPTHWRPMLEGPE